MRKLAKLTEALSGQLLKYLVAAIFIFIPLYPKFPLFFLPGTTVAVRAEDFLIAAASVIFVINFISHLTTKKLPPLTFQVGIFIFIGLLSSISAIYITKNVHQNLVLLHFFRRIEYVLVFFMAYHVGVKNIKNRQFLFELILLPSAGVFLYGIAQIFMRAPVISTMNAEFSKGAALMLQPGVQLSSTFAGHYDLAVYLAMMLVFITVLLGSTRKRIYQIAYFISFILLLWLFVQAGSRISLAGLVIGILLVSALTKRLRLGVLLVLIIAGSLFTSPNLINRLKNLINVVKQTQGVVVQPIYAEEEKRAIQADRSTSIRLDVEWPRAIRSFYKNPFLGTGYSSISLATDSDYFRALGETGLLGLGAFFALLIALGRGLKARLLTKNQLDRNLVIGSLGVFSIFLTTAIFLDAFESSKIATLFWAYTGLAMSTKS